MRDSLTFSLSPALTPFISSPSSKSSAEHCILCFEILVDRRQQAFRSAEQVLNWDGRSWHGVLQLTGRCSPVKVSGPVASTKTIMQVNGARAEACFSCTQPRAANFKPMRRNELYFMDQIAHTFARTTSLRAKFNKIDWPTGSRRVREVGLRTASVLHGRPSVEYAGVACSRTFLLRRT